MGVTISTVKGLLIMSDKIDIGVYPSEASRGSLASLSAVVLLRDSRGGFQSLCVPCTVHVYL